MDLRKQILIHFICMLFTVYPLILLSGWFVINSFIDILKVLGIFISIGILIAIFFIFYSPISLRIIK